MTNHQIPSTSKMTNYYGWMIFDQAVKDFHVTKQQILFWISINNCMRAIMCPSLCWLIMTKVCIIVIHIALKLSFGFLWGINTMTKLKKLKFHEIWSSSVSRSNLQSHAQVLPKNGFKINIIILYSQSKTCSPAVIDLPRRLAQVLFSIPIIVLEYLSAI